MTERPATTEGSEHPDENHRFDDLPDGSGCTEIWELLSERREADG